MKREYAEAIVAGSKTVEYREDKPHYRRRILDKNVLAWSDENDARLSDGDIAYVNPIRQVQSIHFYDYNGTWFLDVSVKETGLVSYTEDDNEEEDLDESNYHYDWLAVIKLNAYFEHVPHDTAWEIQEFVNNLKKSSYFHVTITEDRFSTIYFCTNAIHSLRIEISDTSVEVELRYQDQKTLIDDNALFKTLAFIVH